MTTELATERFLGLYLMAMAIALLLRPAVALELIKASLEHPHYHLLFGLIGVIFGSFIIASHNVWELHPSMLTTVIGWSSLIKGLMFLIAPGPLMRFGDSVYQHVTSIRLASMVVLGLGAAIIYYSY